MFNMCLIVPLMALIYSKNAVLASEFALYLGNSRQDVGRVRGSWEEVSSEREKNHTQNKVMVLFKWHSIYSLYNGTKVNKRVGVV